MTWLSLPVILAADFNGWAHARNLRSPAQFSECRNVSMRTILRKKNLLVYLSISLQEGFDLGAGRRGCGSALLRRRQGTAGGGEAHRLGKGSAVIEGGGKAAIETVAGGHRIDRP